MNSAWPDGLDPEDPDGTFVDGEHEFAVRVAPAAFPTLFMIGGGVSTLSEVVLRILVTLASGVIAMRRDDRWKVVVLRAARKKPALWHAIDVEFLDDEDADRLKVEILESWDSRERADQTVIRLKAVRQLRLDSQPRRSGT